MFVRRESDPSEQVVATRHAEMADDADRCLAKARANSDDTEGVSLKSSFVTVAGPPSAKFMTPMTVPVDLVPGKPPAGVFAGLHPPTPFAFRLQDVVVAASRFLFVRSVPSALPTNMVQEWQAILAWEIEHFWDVNVAASSFESTYAAAGIFTTEHSTRSGEHLAAGIALLYVDQLPWMTVAACEFFPGSGARPDFVLPINLANNKLVGLEARCRAYVASLDQKTEVESIEAKKEHPEFDEMLAVYFHYGQPLARTSSVTKHKSRTRLLVLDPRGEGRMQPEARRRLTILTNYLRICSEVGLRFYPDRIRAAMDAVELSVPLPGPSEREFVLHRPTYHPQVERFGDSNYVGRHFSTALAAAAGLRETQRRELLQTEGLGSYGFVGINSEVLRVINDGDWDALFGFRDRLAHSDAAGPATILSDGYCTHWRPITDPESREASDVRSSM
jgi:hypothetical protein